MPDAPDASSATSAPLIDCHAHIFTADMPPSDAPWSRPKYDFPVERYLQTLDAHGVMFGVIAGISIYGEYNDYMLDVLPRHRRLRGTVIPWPSMDRMAMDRMASGGIVGVRLQWGRIKDVPDLTTHAYQLLFRRIRDLDWHIHVSLYSPRLQLILPALEAAGIKFVVDHYGLPVEGPGLDCPGFKALVRSVGEGKATVKLSAPFRVPDAPLAHAVARTLLSAGGPSQLLWGSDCPFVGHEATKTYASAIADFEAAIPDAATRRAIDENGLRFYLT